jgi:hypothetical protein
MERLAMNVSRAHDAPLLDRNRETLFDLALRAFKGPKIEARLTRIDPRQPHRPAARRAREGANLGERE